MRNNRLHELLTSIPPYYRILMITCSLFHGDCKQIIEHDFYLGQASVFVLWHLTSFGPLTSKRFQLNLLIISKLHSQLSNANNNENIIDCKASDVCFCLLWRCFH